MVLPFSVVASLKALFAESEVPIVHFKFLVHIALGIRKVFAAVRALVSTNFFVDLRLATGKLLIGAAIIGGFLWKD